MALDIILIRHGETHFNREGRIQGSQDSSLSPSGMEQARILGSWINTLPGSIHHWFSSPQPRATHTAEIIREMQDDRNLSPLQTNDFLREINCGQFEGQLRKDLDPFIVQQIRSDPSFPYPGGESILDVMFRCESFVDTLKKSTGWNEEETEGEDKTAVIVAHGHVNRCMGAVLTGLGPYFAMQSAQENGAFNRFRSGAPNGKFKLVSWNETLHLNKTR